MKKTTIKNRILAAIAALGAVSSFSALSPVSALGENAIRILENGWEYTTYSQNDQIVHIPVIVTEEMDLLSLQGVLNETPIQPLDSPAFNFKGFTISPDLNCSTRMGWQDIVDSATSDDESVDFLMYFSCDESIEPGQRLFTIDYTLKGGTLPNKFWIHSPLTINVIDPETQQPKEYQLYSALNTTIYHQANITPTAEIIGGPYYYTGTQITPDVLVKANIDGKEVILQKPADYKLSYGANTEVGENSGTVTINSNNSDLYIFDSFSINFPILPEEIVPGEIEIESNVDTANGLAKFRMDVDFSLFENGGKVYVDENLLDSSEYTAEAGSTIITLSPDYLATLTAGIHTLTVAFNDGRIANTDFTIAAISPIPDSEPQEETEEEIAVPDTGVYTGEKNGAKLGGIILSSIITIAGIIGMIAKIIKSKSAKNS